MNFRKPDQGAAMRLLWFGWAAFFVLGETKTFQKAKVIIDGADSLRLTGPELQQHCIVEDLTLLFLLESEGSRAELLTSYPLWKRIKLATFTGEVKVEDEDISLDNFSDISEKEMQVEVIPGRTWSLVYHTGTCGAHTQHLSFSHFEVSRGKRLALIFHCQDTKGRSEQLVKAYGEEYYREDPFLQYASEDGQQAVEDGHIISLRTFENGEMGHLIEKGLDKSIIPGLSYLIQVVNEDGASPDLFPPVLEINGQFPGRQDATAGYESVGPFRYTTPHGTKVARLRLFRDPFRKYRLFWRPYVNLTVAHCIRRHIDMFAWLAVLMAAPLGGALKTGLALAACVRAYKTLLMYELVILLFTSAAIATVLVRMLGWVIAAGKKLGRRRLSSINALLSASALMAVVFLRVFWLLPLTIALLVSLNGMVQDPFRLFLGIVGLGVRFAPNVPVLEAAIKYGVPSMGSTPMILELILAAGSLLQAMLQRCPKGKVPKRSLVPFALNLMLALWILKLLPGLRLYHLWPAFVAHHTGHIFSSIF